MGVLKNCQCSVTSIYFFKVQDTGGMACACVYIHSVCARKSKWDHAKHAVLQLKLLALRNIPISTDRVLPPPPTAAVVGKCTMLWTYHNLVSIKEDLNCFHIFAILNSVAVYVLAHITVFCEC